MFERAEVTISIPTWLLDEAIDALQQDVGNVTDGELDLAIQEVVQRFLECVASGDKRAPQRLELADALRIARGAKIRWARWRNQLGVCAADLRQQMAAPVAPETAWR